ncbi:MAG: hypothetical protein ACREAE_04045 [Nitrosopumilaceae archaeon]
METDSRIRYVGIYDNGGLFGKLREGLNSILEKEETIDSLEDVVKTFAKRKLLAPKIGYTIYALETYEKVNRVTIPIGTNSLILISTDAILNPSEIVDKILQIRRKHSF